MSPFKGWLTNLSFLQIILSNKGIAAQCGPNLLWIVTVFILRRCDSGHTSKLNRAFGGGYAGQVKSTSYMSQPATQTTTSAAAKLEGALRSIIRGKDDVVRLAIVAVLARGH